MKKILILVLSLVLVLSVGAQAESVLWHDDSSHVLALYARDDSVYLFTNKAYHILTAEGETGKYPYENIEAFEALIPGNDELWALFYDSERNPSIAEVSFDDAGNLSLGERLSFNWTDIQLADEPAIISPMIDDGVFAFVDAEGENRGVVTTYNTETGKGRAFETDADGYLIYAQAIFPYKDGLALVAAAAEDPSGIAFYTFDLLTGEFTSAFTIQTIDPFSFGAPAYDAASDTVYFIMDEQFYRVKDFDPESAEVVGDADEIIAWLYSYAAVLDDETVVVADRHTAWAYQLDAEEESASLSVAADGNELINSSYYAYLENNPDVDAEISNNSIDPGEISQAILTQSTEYDIYVTYVGWQDYAALFDKGYLPSLSESETLTALADEMYSAVENVITQDGALVAFPVGYDMFVPTWNPTAFEALGLTEEDVPTNWMEFLQLLQRLPGLIDGTDITAFDPMTTADELPGELLNAIFDAYELYLESESPSDTHFDTEIMHSLLAEYEKINFSGLGAPDTRDEYADRGEEKNVLFSLETTVSCESYGALRSYYYMRYGEDALALTRPMPLSLVEGPEPLAEGNLIVAIVNPYSKNMEAALAFLETAAEMMPDEMRANLCPNWTEPIMEEDAEETLADLEERVTALEKEVADATGDEQAQYQAMLDEAKADYEVEQTVFAWLVTEDDLSAYHSAAQYMRVWRFFGLNTEGESEFDNQINMYLNGVVDADTMLQNIDKKVNMMLLED